MGMAYIVMAYIGMAYIVIGYTGIEYIIMAYIGMADGRHGYCLYSYSLWIMKLWPI